MESRLLHGLNKSSLKQNHSASEHTASIKKIFAAGKAGFNEISRFMLIPLNKNIRTAQNRPFL